MAAFVTGGCGFIGYHLVKALVQSKEYTSIHVISRDPSKNLVDGAVYHKGDFCSKATIQKLFERIGRVAVIFHVASPASTGNTRSLQSFLRPNVDGTMNLLECARAHGVEAFVFSSSVVVYQADKNNNLVNASETSPLITLDGPTDSYSKSKAEADRRVLAANGLGNLKTVSIRISSSYGERDMQQLGGILDNKTKWRSQIGDNKNIWDRVSAENACTLHVLAARAVLQNKLGIAGEAFNVTDDQPTPFWTFVRLVWKLAGVDVREEEVKTVPAAPMIIMAAILEWIYWIFTFGQRTPEQFRRRLFEYMSCNRTFSIEKAKERLGYVPVDNRIEGIRAGVEWYEKQHAGKTRKEK
ncbi:MAG: hypothetical protein GOMPHAMPRED_006618 [Gomphillus americanus]|uniref:3-beta hydroxysteroid dehydrogenase/isomerase domain-containing protein n=1 Tax=Gomphillus americanus TaxID=1940652 RepID=A0A8H3IYH2_9LECA|nr:MAG: hypothetical protein GOMPHAMPRED_006618 [Gomphillus americanus]